MADQTQNYVPGVCNIGAAEVRQRRQAGYLGLGITLLLWAIFIVFHVTAPWRLILFLPASIGATGFLQAQMRFCAGFGMQGVYNFGTEVGKVIRVEQLDARYRDRKKARMIVFLSAIIGVAVAFIGYFTGL
ncbi:MAG TPA: hypothetical protein VMW73_03815 [Spirochaetia bacterium]|nr:hypothetical protein [Spirochaetia bacterium]